MKHQAILYSISLYYIELGNFYKNFVNFRNFFLKTY